MQDGRPAAVDVSSIALLVDQNRLNQSENHRISRSEAGRVGGWASGQTGQEPQVGKYLKQLLPLRCSRCSAVVEVEVKKWFCCCCNGMQDSGGAVQ